MERGIEFAFCPSCKDKVRVTATTAPGEAGQATLPDGAQIVCLDFQEGCSDHSCPLTGVAGIVMGVRLARSGLRAEDWETVHARCEGCGQMSDLEVLDGKYGYCPLCGTTNHLMLLTLDDESRVVVSRPGEDGAPSQEEEED